MLRSYFVFALVLGGFALIGVSGCDGCGGSAARDAGSGDGGVGDVCASDGDCRSTLGCIGGTCEARGITPEGSPCQLTADCEEGLYCGPHRTCERAGTAAEGDACQATSDCMPGLLCVVEGFARYCRAAGTGDLGDACASDIDCIAGLACAMSGASLVCLNPPPVASSDGGLPPDPVTFWAGEDCSAMPAPAEPTAVFEVPRTGGPQLDFYSLPYPNDIRRTATGGLDLSGYPHPGALLSVDVVDRYARASESDLDGFATNAVVHLRFSKEFAFDSVSPSIVDITPGSPTYGAATALSWLNTFGSITRYICPHWMAMRPPHGSPLLPRTTYAAIVSAGVVATADGTPFVRSPDLTALLAPSAPSDPDLARAYAAYAPLRAWLTSSETDPSTILNAAVFTTQSVEPIVPSLRAAVRAGATPAVSDVTVCDAGVRSPCDDGTPERACNAPDPSFVEVHGRIALPIFQAGSPPYERPEDGGAIMLDASGAPLVARTEPVCFALTVPRGVAPPAEGFPIVVVAHGTGGSFTGAVRSGLSAAVASGDAGGTPVLAATLSIDLPEHGARRGTSTRSPEELFYNFANPRAARDNILQGSADLMTLIRWASEYAADAAASPTGEALSFDGTRIVVFAHSQGATHASLLVGFEPLVSSIVLSGNGGDLTQSLLTKTEPVDIASAVPYALLDGELGADGRIALTSGEFHPALGLFQAYFERVDPVNFARRLYRDPIEGDTGRHVFMTYGVGDHYSTPPTMQAFAAAAALPLVRPTLDAFGLSEVDPPLSGNVMVSAVTRTVGMRQYTPDAGDDGHFVALETVMGRADVIRFLLGALAGMTPVIGEGG